MEVFEETERVILRACWAMETRQQTIGTERAELEATTGGELSTEKRRTGLIQKKRGETGRNWYSFRD